MLYTWYYISIYRKNLVIERRKFIDWYTITFDYGHNWSHIKHIFYVYHRGRSRYVNLKITPGTNVRWPVVFLLSIILWTTLCLFAYVETESCPIARSQYQYRPKTKCSTNCGWIIISGNKTSDYAYSHYEMSTRFQMTRRPH